MYTTKVQQSILYTSPNLKAVRLERQVHGLHLLKYSFIIRQLTLEEARNALRRNLRKQKILDFIKAGLTAVPRSLKQHSSSALRIWARQCECVVAQKLRRGQQMFSLYSRLWEEQALRDFARRMRQHVMKKGKEFMLGAVGIASYNWEQNRIVDAEIMKHTDELKYLYFLKEKTFVCDECKNKKVSSNKPNLTLCGCPKSHKVAYDSWAPFIESKDLIVWRRPYKGHYEYKVYGSYDDVNAIDFLDTQMDTEYRKKWDNTAVTLEVVEKDATSDSDIIYWEMLWPRLFANRDYVFNRRYIIDPKKKIIIFKNLGTKHPSCPVKSDKYRVEDYYSFMVIKPYTDLDKPGIEFGLTYYDNPGVSIPEAVTSWVAMKAMPEFLKRLREATKDYKAYCERTGQVRVRKVVNKKSLDPEEEPVMRTSLERNFSALRVGKDEVKVGPEVTPGKEGISGMEVLISPSTSDGEGSSYWKYLRPTYYFG